MPDMLLELFCQEIPARMQARAAADLGKLVTDRLVETNFTYEGSRTYVTPRRLVLHVTGLPEKSPGIKETRKGPRVGAPEQAINGFLKAAGLASIDDAEIISDPKKGEFYQVVTTKPGEKAKTAVAEVISDVISKFPWPKSMRWGASSVYSDSLRWVRPLESILLILFNEIDGAEIINLKIGDIASGNITFGHRFMAPAPITVTSFESYATGLENAKVKLGRDIRRSIIEADASTLAFAKSLEVVPDPGLLDEICGLVEWPVTLMGRFDETFLAMPDEVIRTSIREHQKCFVVREPKSGQLTNQFILVANIEASDGGKAIIAGNERVIHARLSDAAFFWHNDRKVALETRLPQLDQITFHAKLGTQSDRVANIRRLARKLSGPTHADAELADRAALLCKADLVSEMVSEFPELQGLMGSYYALAHNENSEVAQAIQSHYQPLGPSDNIPTEPVSTTVALAEKLVSLTGFWSINEKPTGSKDPYALRRAALGVIRIILEGNIRLPLLSIFKAELDDKTASDLLSFFADRLKVHLREEGLRHDMIDAVFKLGDQDDLVSIVARVKALDIFLASDQGANLLAGYRRAVNILKVEDKKTDTASLNDPDRDLMTEPQEITLFEALQKTDLALTNALTHEDFEDAMMALSELRGPVDNFFDKVMVNDPSPDLRANRLALLSNIRTAANKVARFDTVAGQ